MLLVVDFQERLLPFIRQREQILEAATLLIRGAAIFELPILATEQYPKGIGSTDSALAREIERAGGCVMEKMAFSSCGESALRDELRRIDRDQVIVCGIEAHVCVQQTALDLVTMDYHTAVCADAIGSRSPVDYSVALERMRQMGAAVTTVESVLFELCTECGTPRFKKMIELIKARISEPAGQE
jgi:nicotinamidase-related amidase